MNKDLKVGDKVILSEDTEWDIGDDVYKGILIETIPAKHIIICEECGKEILGIPIIFRGIITKGELTLESMEDWGYRLPAHFHESCFERRLNIGLKFTGN